jgi:cation-transporting P-type ATPase I
MAMQAPWPLQTGSRLVSAAGGLAGWLAGRGGREVWGAPGRIHIEAHGVHGPGGAAVARRVERVLAEHPGVRWVRVNAPACRVVIGLADPPASRRELIALVGELESAPRTTEEEIAEEELHHPAESTRRSGLLPNLAVDGAALALAGITRVVRWAPLPAELAGLVSAAELHPRVRELVASRLHGAERAGSALSMASGLAQGLASRGTSAVLDIAQRVSQWQEAGAERQAWREAEPRLIRGPEHAGAEAVAIERPCPVPDGPVERYQQRILAAGAATVPLATPLVGLRRAMAAGLASLPKATEAGRNAFAARLGAVLSKRGALVMDRSALRHLGRLDTLVVDGQLVRSARWTLTDLVPLAGADQAEVAEQGFELFAPDAPGTVAESGPWRLGPVAELGLAGRTGVREQQRLRDRGAEHVLGLAYGRRLLALFAVRAEPVPGLEALVRAAHRGGLRVVLATDQPHHPYADLIGDVLHLGAFGAVRRLQAAGGTVLLLSDDRRALGAADCGLGVHQHGEPPPWGAHVLIDSGLAEAVLLVEAAGAARLVDRDAITLAKTATALGAVNALAGAGAVAGRSQDAVNAGAGLVFADGVW